MTMRGIDTLAIARKLEAAGVDRGQAEAHAEAINETVVIRYSELATKADLERFPTRENPEPFATKDDLKRFATKEDLKSYPTREEMNLAFARLQTRMILMWSASTVSLAGLIIAMPFVAG